MARIDEGLITSLERTTREYVTREKKRLENERKVLEDILRGRTGGRGVQKLSVAVVEAVAQNDLSEYLKGR